jgi:hypothetical protein
MTVAAERKDGRTPERAAMDYAERQLEVHAAYERAMEAASIFEDRAGVITETAKKLRDIDSRITDREMDLVDSERAKPEIAEQSQAAFDRHIKVVFRKDPELAELRDARRTIQAEHERAEYDAERAKITARVESARMEELGGLLHFYAAVKHTAANEK